MSLLLLKITQIVGLRIEGNEKIGISMGLESTQTLRLIFLCDRCWEMWLCAEEWEVFSVLLDVLICFLLALLLLTKSSLMERISAHIFRSQSFVGEVRSGTQVETMKKHFPGFLNGYAHLTFYNPPSCLDMVLLPWGVLSHISHQSTLSPRHSSWTNLTWTTPQLMGPLQGDSRLCQVDNKS